MDPQTVSFTPRDDIWRIHSDMLRVQQTQADHAERLLRLERRQEDDARMKSVWGTTSPFPSILGGTPQQGPIQQPTVDAFSGFDDQHSNLIGSLHLDADDEPRRSGGATSRANSVRFDETANQGHWSHASRSSVDLIPRAGSGLGGHPMTERSYSHKSDGRQSSAHSVHSATSGRANSLGLDTTFGLSHSNPSPIEPPGLAPGLFILGPVPSIIRCWLNTNFKHDSLLYAAVCTASYTSLLDLRLIEHLGFQEQVTHNAAEGNRKINLAMYFPEAVPQPASSRSSSPAPQLPSITVDFTVVERGESLDESKAIQIFLGSDVLRAHNADVLFSSNTMTLYDDDQSKLSIPLVRPEDDRTFKCLCVTSNRLQSIAKEQDVESKSIGQRELDETLPLEQPPASASATTPTPDDTVTTNKEDPPLNSSTNVGASSEPIAIPSIRASEDPPTDQRPLLGLLDTRSANKDVSQQSSATSSLPRSGSTPAIWGNWRRDVDKGTQLDWANAGKTTSSTYQRRDAGIKVLKPLKLGSRTFSGTQANSSSPSSGQSRFFDEGRRRVSTDAASSQLKRTTSAETKSPATGKENAAAATVGKPRSANPIGGASAFPWLNGVGQSK